MLSFPDVNVWMAVLLAEHSHHDLAKSWWRSDNSDSLCFTRITQLSVLRLLTTPAIMNGKPLTMNAAWKAYDRLFLDERVTYSPETDGIEKIFRDYTSTSTPSPKVWADSWLLAMAKSHNGTVITFDKGLAARGECVLLA